MYTLRKTTNRSHQDYKLISSCYAFLKISKTRKRFNRTSSDPR